MKYKKKPVVIEAIQWTGLNLEEVTSGYGIDLEEVFPRSKYTH